MRQPVESLRGIVCCGHDIRGVVFFCLLFFLWVKEIKPKDHFRCPWPQDFHWVSLELQVGILAEVDCKN